MRGTVALIALACVLMLPSLNVGFAVDDHVQRLRVRADTPPESQIAGFGYAPLDLFTFAPADDALRAAMQDEGVFAWWAGNDVQLSFWRPLSVLTHLLDHRAWPESPALMYLHSIAWFALLLVVLATLYRRLHAPGLALVALAIFALDDAHGPTVGFISNRNAVVAAALSMLVLVIHDRWRRDRWRPGAVLGPFALAAALLAGEASVAAVGYLVAYALFLERGRAAERARSISAYLIVAVGWFAIYQALGYGAHGSGVYLDPGSETAAFLAGVAQRLPPLFLGQVAAPPSDFWLMYPATLALGLWCVAIAVMLFGLWLLWPHLKADRALRFWALGSLLAAVPVCASFPSDRLLMLVGVGVAPLLATLIRRAGAQPAENHEQDIRAPHRRGARPVAFLLIAIHLVIAPMLLPIRVRSMDTVQRSMALFDRVVPSTPDIARQEVIVVTSPSDGLVCYLPLIRASERRARPARMRLLASGAAEVSVTRVDERTVSVRPGAGFVSSTAEQMLRSPDDAFSVGDTVALTGMTATVTEVEQDRALEATFSFAEPIDSDRYLWITWNASRFERFDLPAVGETVTLPPVDPWATLSEVFE